MYIYVYILYVYNTCIHIHIRVRAVLLKFDAHRRREGVLDIGAVLICVAHDVLAEGGLDLSKRTHSTVREHILVSGAVVICVAHDVLAEGGLDLQNVFSYDRMRSLTRECVLLLFIHCRSLLTEYRRSLLIPYR